MPGALKALDRYGIQACLVDRDDSISTLLEALPNWQKAYSDNVSVLYVRKDAGKPAASSGAETSKVPRERPAAWRR
jgi:uroporphyrinogen-III synthase